MLIEKRAGIAVVNVKNGTCLGLLHEYPAAAVHRGDEEQQDHYVPELQQDLLLPGRRMKEWHIYIDGASLGNPGLSGAGMVAFDEDGQRGMEGEHPSRHDDEQHGRIRGTCQRPQESRRPDAGVPVHVYTDSQLVANQVLGKYRIKNERLKVYLEEAHPPDSTLCRTFR